MRLKVANRFSNQSQIQVSKRNIKTWMSCCSPSESTTYLTQTLPVLGYSFVTTMVLPEVTDTILKSTGDAYDKEKPYKLPHGNNYPP